MNTMTVPVEIDLAQVGWPFCLLELKSALGHLIRGQILRVKVSDPLVFSTMIQILYASPDRVLRSGKQKANYFLTIEKG